MAIAMKGHEKSKQCTPSWLPWHWQDTAQALPSLRFEDQGRVAVRVMYAVRGKEGTATELPCLALLAMALP